jgi:glycine/D-amino acid oxidase-like deaminating enzyme
MRTTPLWADSSAAPPLPAANVPERLDVAVVGGGYTGLAAALVLARRGTAVAVFEQGPIGAGASAVNGGQLTTGLKQAGPRVFAAYGEELGRELWQASVAAVRFVETMIRDEQIDCGYTPGGTLSLAYRPAHYERLARTAEWLRNNVGHHRELVPRSEMRTEIGSDAFFGGLRDPLGGGLHPAKLLFGLARTAAAAGARIATHTRVAAIRRLPRAAGFRLRYAGAVDGEVTADRVLVATNGYTDGLVPRLQARVFPVGSYMIATAPLSPELRHELSPRRRAFFDTRWFLNYFGLTPDGRMAFGGRNNLSTNLPLADSAVLLRRSMLRVFPQLAEVEITHSWTGRLGFSFDLLPHIGEIGGICYALGYCGHGLALASYLGYAAAAQLAGESRSNPFAAIPHETHFFYGKRPWFLPMAAAYYRTLDRFR